MAKGRSDDCVKADCRRTGMWVTLEHLSTTWGQAAKLCSTGAKGLPLHSATAPGKGLAHFLSSLALSMYIPAPDSPVQYRLALRLFYVTLGMKYK